jgi:ABC-type Mn2+/Zn2+ transport system permease subunit
MEKSVAYLVVLLPAIASVLALFVSEVLPGMRRGYGAFMASRHKVEWLRELISHAAFYGTAVGAALGASKESAVLASIGAAWFVALITAAYWLTEQLEQLDEEASSGAAASGTPGPVPEEVEQPCAVPYTSKE